MDLVYRIKGILFAPAAEWSVIARERTDLGALAGYAAMLAAIPALAQFFGDSWLGLTLANGAVRRVPFAAGLVGALLDDALGIAAVAVVALIVNLLARRFGATPSYPDALRVAAYSFTPYWVVSVCRLLPGLRFLCVLGVCGLWTAWAGLIRLMRSPPEAALRYATAATAGAIVVVVLMSALSGLLLARLAPF